MRYIFPVRERKIVSAAIAISEDRTKVLLTKRKMTQRHGGKWEFPGGKVESGESPQVGLARELREELACRSIVGRPFEVVHHSYPDFDVILIFFLVQLLDAPQCVEVAEAKWFTPGELTSADILEADLPLIRRISGEGVPSFV